MDLRELDLEKLRSKLRSKVSYHVGFACPDIDDIVQDSLTRFLEALRQEKIRSREADGAFLNGICRNVIFEYRRRLFRDAPMPDAIPEPPSKGLPQADLFELRDAIASGMAQLSARDRQVLRALYLEEKSTDEILVLTGLTIENFRVVLSRAKDRFRQIYLAQMKYKAASNH